MIPTPAILVEVLATVRVIVVAVTTVGAVLYD